MGILQFYKKKGDFRTLYKITFFSKAYLFHHKFTQMEPAAKMQKNNITNNSIIIIL